jgi:uncharacterized protein (DUF2062 family)
MYVGFSCSVRRGQASAPRVNPFPNPKYQGMPRKLLRRFLPDPHRIRKHSLLAWLGPRLHDPRLWHVSREGIAVGAAVGGFFGLLLPIAQIPMAVIAAIALRGNVPMAAAITLITNPFTFAPIYYVAYRLGLLLTGAQQSATATTSVFDADPHGLIEWVRVWFDYIVGLGKPLFIGLFVLASGFAVVCYFSINFLWRVLTRRAWHGRSARRKATTDSVEK